MPEQNLPAPAEVKLCRGCGEVKPLGGFPRDRARSDGRNYRCCECERRRWANGRRTPEATRNPFPSAEERFWAAVDQRESGACWEWTGALRDTGYGTLSVDGRPTLAHRFSYFLHHGRWPERVIDHLCGDRRCVNPAHLEDVSQHENTLRARRSHCKHGHLFDEENTAWRPGKNGPTRRCRACHRDEERERQRRRRAAE